MTSNPPGQGFQNKNRVAILAELDKEKRRLIQNQTMNSPGASIPLSRPAVNKDFRDHAEQQHIAAQQKAALQAENQSCYQTDDFYYPHVWGLLQHSPSSVKSRHSDVSPQHAHAHSSGFFITQDSSFGNLILPVLPRQEAE